MSFCPADLKPCIDDLCRSGARCFKTGDEMLGPCPGCRRLIATDGSDTENCDCEPDDDIDYGDDQ